MVNLLARLVAYTYQEKKPSLDIDPKDLPALSTAAFYSYFQVNRPRSRGASPCAPTTDVV
ncbi:hypothetical protein PQG02_13795 [Nostoc sp. UHCC 0926]|nr:hypothetical protein [Nostoc sp. UHCC 0926]WDD35317.1 hypothetical protein PQG02_13795 [Nostoc sp. UHCC 0926]